MAVSMESINEIERRVNVEIAWEEFDQKQQAEYKKLQQKARIDGFRPGKAPLQVLKKHYGEAIQHDIMIELMRDSFTKLVEEQKLDIAGRPTFDPKHIDQGQPFTYTATFEIYPTFELVDLKGHKIIRYVSAITDAHVNKSIEKLRRKHCTWVESNQAAKEGDQVEIDFVGTLNGEPFEGGKAENYHLVLGENRMIAGFESGIVGTKAGEKLQLNLTFPEEYHVKALAGKPVQFAITVHKVESPELPELNQAFFDKLGITDGGLEFLQKETRENMQRELDNALESRMKEQVFSKLTEVNNIIVPKALVEAEIDYKIEQFYEEYQNLGMKKRDLKVPRDLFRQAAHKSAKLSLLLHKMVEVFKLEPDTVKVDELIKKRASIYTNAEEMIKRCYENERVLNGMKDLALEQKVLEMLIDTADVENQSIDYFELLGNH